MPNWCATSLAFFAEDKKYIDNLQRLFYSIKESITNGTSVKQDFGRGWLGNVAIKHGLEFDENTGNLVDETIRSCGWVINMDESIEEDSTFFIIDVSSAWTPMIKLWKYVISQYEGVDFYFCAEECGNGIFVNTDIKGEFLPERYLLLSSSHSNTELPSRYFNEGLRAEDVFGDYLYFENFEQVLSYLKSLTDRNFANANEVNKFFEEALASFKHDIQAKLYEFEESWDCD